MALKEYKCPNCSGPISFNPGTQELTCPYCNSIINIEALNYMDEQTEQTPEEQAAIWDYDGNSWHEGEEHGLVVYTCNSCSGEIVGDETLGAATCPFCGSPVVMTAKFAGSLRPDLVIPFKLDKDYALSSLDKHYAKKRLLPDVFKENNHLEDVKGVYVPFWLYDADTDSHMEYRGTKVRTWSDRNYIYTETSHFQIIRGGALGFDAVPADGSEKVDDALMESIEPYNMGDWAGFNTAYLAGFYANKYDKDAKECSPRANERIKNTTTAEFRKTVVGYNSVRQVSSNVRINCGGVRYALFPVWLLGSTWEDKSFIFAMNGQTGKFVGDLPLDKAKRRRLYWTMFGIIAASLLAISQAYIAFIM
ncbi:MAG: TFIIB-type zinc ribbon-containing protein [Oscillospiraceae bacterium]|nr:TFIIB-type zinc ribbon-containing protein [Oscillospiraceae bacterium]